MREEGLIARAQQRFHSTTDSRHDDPIAPNLLEREFSREAKSEVGVTDVTAIWTAEGWLFLAVMLDLFSRRVVGWATSAHNDRFLALLHSERLSQSDDHRPASSTTRTAEVRTPATTTAPNSSASASLRA